MLGGALLVELALTERVEVEAKSKRWSAAKVHATATAPPEDAVDAAISAAAIAGSAAATSAAVS